MRTLRTWVFATTSACLVLPGSSIAPSAQTPSARSSTPSERVPVTAAMKLVGVVDGGRGAFAAFINLATGERRLVAPQGRVGGATVESVGRDAVVLALEGTLSIDIGQVLVTFGAAAPSEITETQALLDPIGLVSVRGSVQAVADASWRVVLDDHRTGASHAIAEGETVGGYTAVLVRPRAVVIAAASTATTLTTDHATTGIPDLVGMPVLARDRWIAHWRSGLGSLPAEQQRDEREQMRSYWRGQWQGSWGTAVASALTLSQQEALRSVIANYWR
jgi:hypothetical protein